MASSRCPALRAVRRHVAEFAAMMRELGGDRLDGWMRVVDADGISEAHPALFCQPQNTGPTGLDDHYSPVS